MAQAATPTTTFVASRHIDYLNPYLSARRIHHVDSLLVMLEDFIDAEQDAVTYHGPVREYIPSDFERVEVQGRPLYDAPARSRHSFARLYGKPAYPLSAAAFSDDEDDLDSDDDGPWGCPSLTSDSDSSESAFDSEAESDSSSLYTDDSDWEWELEEYYSGSEGPEVVEVRWEQWEQLRELRGGGMGGVLPVSELWGRGVHGVDADDFVAFEEFDV
ncbi:hypothetical protein C8Q73DRAFT_839436 [Cubamyces lactineus]|nr:hypothetical protein C8Q73DRAFT_839436 [Cubamyces lactineus]